MLNYQRVNNIIIAPFTLSHHFGHFGGLQNHTKEESYCMLLWFSGPFLPDYNWDTTEIQLSWSEILENSQSHDHHFPRFSPSNCPFFGSPSCDSHFPGSGGAPRPQGTARRCTMDETLKSGGRIRWHIFKWCSSSRFVEPIIKLPYSRWYYYYSFSNVPILYFENEP